MIITLEVFLSLLMAVSVLTSITVEGVKKFMGEKYKVSSNIVAGLTAIAMATVVSACYWSVMNYVFGSHFFLFVAVLAFFSWLCAMIGYDKVVQAIMQIKNFKASK